MHGSTFVAVKVVFLKEDELRETLLEMEILERCNHPNITKYYDCYLKGLDLWVSSCYIYLAKCQSIIYADPVIILDLYGILWWWFP